MLPVLNVTDGDTETETLMIGFRDNLVGIVDEALNQIKCCVNMDKFENKIDKLEKIVLENKSDFKILTEKIDEVIAHQQRLTC